MRLFLSADERFRIARTAPELSYLRTCPFARKPPGHGANHDGLVLGSLTLPTAPEFMSSSRRSAVSTRTVQERRKSFPVSSDPDNARVNEWLKELISPQGGRHSRDARARSREWTARGRLEVCNTLQARVHASIPRESDFKCSRSRQRAAQKLLTSLSSPVISQRMRDIGIVPAARNRSWNSRSENRSRS